MSLSDSLRVDQPWFSGVAEFTLTATTAAPGATVTIHRITPTGDSITISWGDGGADTVVADGVTAAQAHVYAAANTYDITVTDASLITQLDIHDNQLSGFDSSELSDNVITYFRMYLLGNVVVDSADMVLWMPTAWYLFSMAAGTYSIDSADMVLWDPTQWRMSGMPAGTYAIVTDDMSAWTPVGFDLYSMHASATFTIAEADFNGWITTSNLRMSSNALPQADVDAILEGHYGAFPARTAVNGTINVGGTNAAPSGVLQAQCPPTTGLEWAFELKNDSCGVSANHWLTVTTS